jgi:hypothetical protein
VAFHRALYLITICKTRSDGLGHGYLEIRDTARGKLQGTSKAVFVITSQLSLPSYSYPHYLYHMYIYEWGRSRQKNLPPAMHSLIGSFIIQDSDPFNFVHMIYDIFTKKEKKRLCVLHNCQHSGAHCDNRHALILLPMWAWQISWCWWCTVAYRQFARNPSIVIT